MIVKNITNSNWFHSKTTFHLITKASCQTYQQPFFWNRLFSLPTFQICSPFRLGLQDALSKFLHVVIPCSMPPCPCYHNDTIFPGGSHCKLIIGKLSGPNCCSLLFYTIVDDVTAICAQFAGWNYGIIGSCLHSCMELGLFEGASFLPVWRVDEKEKGLKGRKKWIEKK